MPMCSAPIFSPRNHPVFASMAGSALAQELLFVNDLQRAQEDAVLYGHIKTSKLHGLNKFVYLPHAFKELRKVNALRVSRHF